ncbi:hypothetical protein ACFL1G_11795 [Planctomycetota bacterium]
MSKKKKRAAKPTPKAHSPRKNVNILYQKHYVGSSPFISPEHQSRIAEHRLQIPKVHRANYDKGTTMNEKMQKGHSQGVNSPSGNFRNLYYTKGTPHCQAPPDNFERERRIDEHRKNIPMQFRKVYDIAMSGKRKKEGAAEKEETYEDSSPLGESVDKQFTYHYRKGSPAQSRENCPNKADRQRRITEHRQQIPRVHRACSNTIDRMLKENGIVEPKRKVRRLGRHETLSRLSHEKIVWLKNLGKTTKK